MPHKLVAMQKQSQNLTSSLPFPWIHRHRNAPSVTRSSSSWMRLVIFIRHVLFIHFFKLNILILDPTRVGHGAEKRDIPRTYHPNACQQNMVPREKRWWRDAPGVPRRWNALVVNDCPCPDNSGSFFLFSYSYLMDSVSRSKTTSTSG